MSELSKLERLKEIICGYKSVLIAFSGGVDSAFVLKVARDVLGRDHVQAVTADSESLSRRELEIAKKLASELDVEHRVIRTHELENENYAANPAKRCYFCKSELYDRLVPIAQELGLSAICNGTNLDDLNDFRPGHEAARERSVKSPLVEAGFTKKDVRNLSYAIGLTIWDKPASPCLSSRVPYGDAITEEKLKQIEKGENFLKDLGFKIVRLRHFGSKARIELGQDEFVRMMDAGLREQIVAFIRSLGFKTAVFEPYRHGSLNEETNSHQVGLQT